MLACARIGAVHSVVFGGFSAESLRDRINDSQARAARHRRRRLSPRPGRAAQADRRRGARSDTPSIETRRRRAAAGRRARSRREMHGRARPLVSRPDAGRVAATASPSRWTRRTCSTSSTPPAPPESRRASSTRPAATCVGTYATTKWVFDLKEDDVYWCTADIGWVTGHSYVVYGPLANGATVVMYEGRARLAGEGSLLGDHRAPRRHDPLHRADGDPRVHALGHRVAGEARPVVAAPARIGRRADQSRGLDVVSPAHRRRALPGRRHVVADRDRRDHDHAAARA